MAMPSGMCSPCSKQPCPPRVQVLGKVVHAGESAETQGSSDGREWLAETFKDTSDNPLQESSRLLEFTVVFEEFKKHQEELIRQVLDGQKQFQQQFLISSSMHPKVEHAPTPVPGHVHDGSSNRLRESASATGQPGNLHVCFAMIRVILDELRQRSSEGMAWSEGEISQMTQFISEFQHLNSKLGSAEIQLTRRASYKGVPTGSDGPIVTVSSGLEASMTVGESCTFPSYESAASSMQSSGGDGVPVTNLSSDAHGMRTSLTKDWEDGLARIFTALDTDNSGSISADELRRALSAAGVPLARLTKMLRAFDSDGSTEIDLEKWISTMRTVTNTEVRDLLGTLAEKSAEGTLFVHKQKKSACILHPTAKFRVSWDTTILATCIYIALFLPFILAWEDLIPETTHDKLWFVDRVIDAIYCLDIVLNFNTGFYNKDSDLIMTRGDIVRHYLHGWFLVDAVSTFPFDLIGVEAAKNIQVLKLLKLGKLLKILKLMMHADLSDFSETLEDMSTTKTVQMIYRRSAVLVNAIFVSHWMACGMKLVDEGFLDVRGRIWGEYLGAYYWSMTTLTTVGYGDITPDTDAERIFTTVAMVIGGGFYGYVVGSVTGMVQNSDLNATAFYDRMELIHAWLTHHKLPAPMKKRLRRYFKAYWKEKSAVTEADIWRDLSPELQREVGDYILHAEVKANPLFDGMNIGSIVRLQSILQRIIVHSGREIVKQGEAGTAMYILVDGALQMKSIADLIDVNRGVHVVKDSASVLGPGQFYGEEILLGFKEFYEYTIMTLQKSTIEMIAEDEFLSLFERMPNVLERMRQNALSLNPKLKDCD